MEQSQELEIGTKLKLITYGTLEIANPNSPSPYTFAYHRGYLHVWRANGNGRTTNSVYHRCTHFINM